MLRRKNLTCVVSVSGSSEPILVVQLALRFRGGATDIIRKMGITNFIAVSTLYLLVSTRYVTVDVGEDQATCGIYHVGVGIFLDAGNP